MPVLTFLRPLSVLVFLSCLLVGCSSTPSEVDDSPPVESVNEERGLADFIALSEKNRERYEGEMLGNTARVGEYGEEGLVLHGVDELSSGEASELVGFDGRAIFFPDLKKLTPEAAAKLSAWGDETARLEFYALEKLGESTAAALVGWQGRRLGFDGMTHLELETAKAIGQWYGDVLAMNGLTDIEAEIAAELIRAPRQKLKLDGVEEVDMDTAEVLAMYHGDILGLMSLEQWEDDVMEVLENFGGKLQLQ